MNDSRRGCVARRHGDQMHCARCGLQYDVNDPEPPRCLTTREFGQAALAEMKEALSGE